MEVGVRELRGVEEEEEEEESREALALLTFDEGRSHWCHILPSL